MESTDVSRKLYQEDIIVLNEIENTLLRRGIKTSQKELLHQSVKIIEKHKGELIAALRGEVRKDNTKELIQKFLNRPKVDFGKDFLSEIDTTL